MIETDFPDPNPRNPVVNVLETTGIVAFLFTAWLGVLMSLPDVPMGWKEDRINENARCTHHFLSHDSVAGHERVGRAHQCLCGAHVGR